MMLAGVWTNSLLDMTRFGQIQSQLQCPITLIEDGRTDHGINSITIPCWILHIEMR